MKKYLLYVLSCFLCFNFSLFAIDFSVCPSIEQLHKYKFISNSLEQFDKHTSSLIFSAIFADDSLFLDKRSYGDNRAWVLILSNLQMHPEENAIMVMRTVFRELIAFSSRPIMFKKTPFEEIPVCIYTVPGNNDIYAKAYLIDGNLDYRFNISSLLKIKENLKKNHYPDKKNF